MTRPNNGWILILEKDGCSKIVNTWIYPIAPEVYYDSSEIAHMNEYRLIHVKDNRAYYKFIVSKEGNKVS